MQISREKACLQSVVGGSIVRAPVPELGAVLCVCVFCEERVCVNEWVIALAFCLSLLCVCLRKECVGECMGECACFLL